MRIDSETGIVMYHGALMRSRIAVRLLQFIHLAFGALYIVLGARFALEYIRARDVEFVRLVNRVSDVFYRPFAGIVPNGADPAGHPIAWSLVIAVIVYLLVHAILAGIVRALARTRYADID